LRIARVLDRESLSRHCLAPMKKKRGWYTMQRPLHSG
jgi:hypothetical protein